jgi:hypothetical protein
VLRRLAALAVALALLASPPAEAAPRPPSVPACALGSSAADLRGFYAAALARAERRFAARFPRGSAHARRLVAAGVAAYVYGLAPLALQTVPAPTNQLLSVAALANPGVRSVVLPNNDTAYTVGRLELSAGPVVLDLPETAGRYYVIQLLDAYSNTFANVGRRTTGTRARSFAIAPLDDRGTVPSGVQRIESPTRSVWLLGRTLVRGTFDLPAVAGILHGFRLTPLSAWTAGARQASTVLPAFPRLPTILLPHGLDFFSKLGDALESNPPPARDACAVRAFGKVLRVPSSGTPAATERALQFAERAGRRLVRAAERRAGRYSARRNNGWLIPGPYVGNYGRNYLGRALIATTALAANVPAETVYPLAATDSRGRPLSGRHRYRIRFPRGRLPPARAFWSVTMYGEDRFLVENAIGRYSIGDRTPGLRRGCDGSLTILIQHRRPAGAASANWLPAPSGRFRLAMRLYVPRRSALSGEWKPPRILRRYFRGALTRRAGGYTRSLRRPY